MSEGDIPSNVTDPVFSQILADRPAKHFRRWRFTSDPCRRHSARIQFV